MRSCHILAIKESEERNDRCVKQVVLSNDINAQISLVDAQCNKQSQFTCPTAQQDR